MFCRGLKRSYGFGDILFVGNVDDHAWTRGMVVAPAGGRRDVGADASGGGEKGL